MVEDPFAKYTSNEAVEALGDQMKDYTIDHAEKLKAIDREIKFREARRFADDKESKQSASDFIKSLSSGCVDIVHVDLFKVDTYLVKHLIYLPGVLVLHSPPGVGKSFMALDLAFHLSLGMKYWCGQRIKKRVKVLYVYSEGITRLWKRRDAWLMEHGVSAEDVGEYLTFYPVAIPLNESDAHVDALVDFMKAKGYEMIIFDTWATATTGSDENSAGDMGIALARCGRLRDEAKVSVVVVHHDSKSGGYRGSTAIDGYADTRLSIERNGDADAGNRDLVVKIEKQRDDVMGTEWHAQLRVVEVGRDEDDEPVTSVVFTYIEDNELVKPPEKVTDFKATCQSVWKMIQDAHAGLCTEGYDEWSYPIPIVTGVLRNTSLVGTPTERKRALEYLVAKKLVVVKCDVQRRDDDGATVGKRYNTVVPIMNTDLTFNNLTFDQSEMSGMSKVEL